MMSLWVRGRGGLIRFRSRCCHQTRQHWFRIGFVGFMRASEVGQWPLAPTARCKRGWEGGRQRLMLQHALRGADSCARNDDDDDEDDVT